MARVALSTRGTAVNKTHQMSAFLEGPFSCVETDTTKSIKQINRKSFQTGKKKSGRKKMKQGCGMEHSSQPWHCWPLGLDNPVSCRALL